MVWGQDDTVCSAYTSDAKIAFYVAALNVFSSSFFTPLLRQRYVRSCELSLMQVLESVTASMDNAQLDWQFDVLCCGDSSKVRLLVDVTKSSSQLDLRTAIANMLKDREGYEEWTANELQISVCRRQRLFDQEGQDLSEVVWERETRLLRSEDTERVVPNNLQEDEHLHGGNEWACEEEYTTARLVVTLRGRESLDARYWDELMDEWGTIQALHHTSSETPGVTTPEMASDPPPNIPDCLTSSQVEPAAPPEVDLEAQETRAPDQKH